MSTRAGLATAVVGCVVTSLGGAVLTLLCGFFWVLNCFDGDGGAPYVARHSPQHAVCTVGHDALGWLIPAAWVVAVAFSVVMVVRWSRRSGPTWLLVVALLSPAWLPGALFVGLNLPSNACADPHDGSADCATY